MNGLELTDVCTHCGAVLWIGQAHSCPRRASAPENATARLGDLSAGRARTSQSPPDRIPAMTLAAEVPARTQDTPDTPALDACRVSHMAATLLRKRYTAESVREHAAGRPAYAYMWLAIASAMDELDAGPVPAWRAAPAPEAIPA